MAKFCPTCGTQLEFESAEICPSCGVRIPTTSPTVTKPESTTDKIKSAGKWIAICCGGIILLMVIAAFVYGMSGNSSSIPASTLSISQIKSQAQAIPYNSLMRNPDTYKNTVVYFKGKVVQIQNQYGDNYILRIATKENSFLGYSDDIVYVDFKGIPEYNGDRILEDDMVDLWGTFLGMKTYSALLGTEVTIPEINALQIELNGVKGTTSNSAKTNTPSTVSDEDGKISIKTSPGKAQIFSNGKYIGITNDCHWSFTNCQPFIIQKTPGKYRIELKVSGYEFETVDVQVNGGETTTIEKRLTKVPIRED